ncbi:MAG: glycosyltransferase [Bacillota bacterium]
MNILIYNTSELYPKKGGVQRISNHLAEELILRGHNVYFMIKKRWYPEETAEIACDMYSIDSDVYDEIAIIRTTQILQEKNIDIVINQSYWDKDFPKFMKENFDIPVITVIHNSPTRDFRTTTFDVNYLSNRTCVRRVKDVINIVRKPYRLHKRKKNAFYQYKMLNDYSDKLVMLSDGFKPELASLVKKYDEHKVCSIPNFTTFEKICDMEMLANKQKVILFVGRLDFNHKRCDRLIEIWEKIYDKYPDWKLRIAGDGPEIENLENYVSKKNIKNVEFLGFVDPVDEYKKAKVLCMTSNFEGMPMVLIEAGLYGCVPMAFDSFASLPDVISHNEDGIIVPSFNMKKYQQELEKLMTDEAHLQRLSEGALKINDKFNKEEIVDKWEDLFEEIINEKR